MNDGDARFYLRYVLVAYHILDVDYGGPVVVSILVIECVSSATKCGAEDAQAFELWGLSNE